MSLAAILFAIAAVGGVVMAIMRFTGRPYPPLILPILHGAGGASGLIVLALAVFGAEGAPSLARIALITLVVAALGGFVVFSFHLRQKALPIPLVVVHALVAVTGFALLLKAMM